MKNNKIFICYAKEDREVAKRIYNILKMYPDVKPWIDDEELLPGKKWEQEILTILEECNFVLIILSNNSVNKKGFVQKEIFKALEQFSYYPPDRIFLIPLRIHDCIPKHTTLRELQWVDLFINWNDGIKKLLRSLNLDYENLEKIIFNENVIHHIDKVSECCLDLLDFMDSKDKKSYNEESRLRNELLESCCNLVLIFKEQKTIDADNINKNYLSLVSILENFLEDTFPEFHLQNRLYCSQMRLVLHSLLFNISDKNKNFYEKIKMIHTHSDFYTNTDYYRDCFFTLDEE